MLVYLDNSATTKPCKAAVDAAAFSMSENYYNPSAAYAQAIEVEQMMQHTRDCILKQVRAKGRIVFTSGGTEADNIAILGAMKKRGASVAVTTAVEHHAVLDCVKSLERHEFIPVDSQGQLDMDALEAALKRNTGIGVVSVMQVNNEVGTIYPVDQIARMVHEHSDALVHCDGVQGFLHVQTPQTEGIDLYTLSGHKIHALKGAGALWIKEGVTLGQVNYGGGQENGERNGTENTPGIAALGAAIETHQALETLSSRIMSNKLSLYHGIMDLYPSAKLNGPEPEKTAPHILNISFTGIMAETLLHALEGEGVLVSTGSACSARRTNKSHVLAAMGLDPARIKSAIRFSLSRDTTLEEINYTLSCLKKILPVLARFKKR